jgi:integrase
MAETFPVRTERLCKPVEEWPECDRNLWYVALRAGDLLEDGGCRATHSSYSNRAMQKGYGRWLTWLDSHGLLDADLTPGDRITPERARAYAADLEQQNATGSVIARLIELKVMATVMARDKDWSYIYRLASFIRARHKPARPKRHRLVPIERLFRLGLDLMAGADNETTAPLRFKTYRDGLIIATLASRPLRLGNLTGLVLGRTLVRRGASWWIQIPAAETKSKNPIEEPWPDSLVPRLESYLADHRAGLVALRGSRSDGLWLSVYGGAMEDNAIYLRVVMRTRAGLGHPINPHLFRDCAATSIAIDDPAHVRLASRLLGHRIGSTTERFYNQASSVEATRAMQAALLARRHRVVDDLEPE